MKSVMLSIYFSSSKTNMIQKNSKDTEKSLDHFVENMAKACTICDTSAKIIGKK